MFNAKSRSIYRSGRYGEVVRMGGFTLYMGVESLAKAVSVVCHRFLAQGSVPAYLSPRFITFGDSLAHLICVKQAVKQQAFNTWLRQAAGFVLACVCPCLRVSGRACVCLAVLACVCSCLRVFCRACVCLFVLACVWPCLRSTSMMRPIYNNSLRYPMSIKYITRRERCLLYKIWSRSEARES